MIKRRDHPRSALTWILWLPVAAFLVYLIVLAINFRSLTGFLLWNADFASLPVVVEGLGSATPDRVVRLLTHPSYSTVWLDQLTEWIPGHRAVWAVGPFLVYMLGSLFAALAALRIAGRWAAAMVFILLVAASPKLLEVTVPQAIHGSTWFNIGLLAFVIVWLATSARAARPWVTWAVIVVAVVVTGSSVASDAYIVLTGLAPFVGAAAVMVLRTRARDDLVLLVRAAAIAVASLVVGWAMAAVMQSLGFYGSGVPSTGLAAADQVPEGAGLYLTGILLNGGGDFFGMTAGVLSGLVVLTALVLLVGLVLLLVVVGRGISRPVGDSVTSAGEGLRLLYLLYWAGVALSVLAFMLLSDAPAQIDLASFRWVTPVFIAIAATLPVLASRASALWRMALAVIVALLVGTAAFRLDSYVGAADEATRLITLVADGPSAVAWAMSRGAVKGYANYWDANPLTYKTAAPVRPVYPCATTAGAPSLCVFGANNVSTWYTPGSGRTFVLVNPAYDGALPLEPIAAFGPPLETRTFGGITVHLYDDDVASRFGPSPPVG